MEEQLIFEIWDTFRDSIPEKGRETAAAQFVDFLVNRDVDVETLESILGYDPHLDSAVELVLAEFRDDDVDMIDEDYIDDEDY